MACAISKQRLGAFTLRREHIERTPEMVQALMGRCIIVRCEMMYGETFEYLAISPDFDEIDPGMAAPEYFTHISEDGARIELKRA